MEATASKVVDFCIFVADAEVLDAVDDVFLEDDANLHAWCHEVGGQLQVGCLCQEGRAAADGIEARVTSLFAEGVVAEVACGGADGALL